MTVIVKKAGLAVATAATALAAAAPADAQRWGDHDGYRRGGDVAGAAIIGGILGLGVGAAIAGSRPTYYAPGYYYRGPYRGYPAPGYYRPGYYDGGYPYQTRCWDQWRWDPYWGRDVRVRVCD